MKLCVTNKEFFMKQITVNGLIVLLHGLSLQITQAQGTTYLSNLGYNSTGSVAVRSDSWFAADFITGTNASGYTLNSIQLAMSDSTGDPSGITVMLYANDGNSAGANPGSNLGILNGSLNPVANGLYTYTTLSDLSLLPRTDYFIVLAAGTMVANGAYQWSVTGTPSPGYTSDHWGGEITFAYSSDGLNWNYTSGIYGQFALNATPVPEPSDKMLLGFGGILLLGFCHWKAKAFQ
jgi:hypothetical protein